MIRLENVCLELPGFSLRDITLTVAGGEYFILVGPYASGKTVLLETIAGLHRASGRVWLDGRDVTSLPPERRNIGIVYQDCALFPHLTVAENIAFGLRVRRRPPAEVNRELERVAGLLTIGDLLTRKPEYLSGGERQKVTLARALASDPRVLLLDEPLGALDPQTRAQVRRELTRLHSKLGLTVIHVTHDFEEAVTMGTRIAVIGAGSIRQVGSPDEIFRHPNSEFVARFTMAVNVLPGTAVREDSGRTVFWVAGIRLEADADIDGRCFAAVRPESILISKSPPDGGAANIFRGVVTGIVNRGSVVEITVEVPPSFTCLVTRHTYEQIGLEIGQQVYLTIPRASVALVRAES